MNSAAVLFAIHKRLRPGLYVELGAKDDTFLQLAFGKTKCLVVSPGYDLIFPYQHDTIIIKTPVHEFVAQPEAQLKKTDAAELIYINGSLPADQLSGSLENLKPYCSRKSVAAFDFVGTRSDEKAAEFAEAIRKHHPHINTAPLRVDEGILLLLTNLSGEAKTAARHLKIQPAEDFNFSKVGIAPNQKPNARQKIRRKLSRKPRALGVLLCYNDADILEEAILHLLANHHKLIAWDHGSDDGTAKVLDKYQEHFVERRFVPRTFDFYGLYPAMSQHLIDCFISDFDWISWPDQDEILEGPDRKKSYYDHITDVFRSKYDWLQFNNFNFWFTDKDDPGITSPVKRVKYYSLFPNCAPRIRSWRASVTNIREFNHNALPGEKYPAYFNLRHYPMRSIEQVQRRLGKDRAAIQRGNKNTHYKAMQEKSDLYKISSTSLHFDDGGELDHTTNFDWRKIYFGE